MKLLKKILTQIIGTLDANSKSSNPPQVSETELGKFSTTILDKTENRQSNIRLTCSKLNNLIIESNQTFSFLRTIGETSEASRI